MADSIIVVSKGGRSIFHEDEAIPDCNNRLTCLNCTKAQCKGDCEKISRQKGRANNKIRYVR